MNRCPPGVDSSFFYHPVIPGQRRQRHDPSRSFPVDLRCQHGSTRFTQVGLPFPVLQGSPRWFLTCQKPPERPPVHPGPSGIIPVHHGGTTVQPPVLPGSPRSMDRGEPGSTGSPVGLGHYSTVSLYPLSMRHCSSVDRSNFETGSVFFVHFANVFRRRYKKLSGVYARRGMQGVNV